MKEMSFLPHQDFMIFQSPHHHHHQDIHNNPRDFNDDHHRHNDPTISSNILSSCPPQDFQGGGPLVPILSMMNRSMSFPSYQHPDHDREDGVGDGGDGDDLSDDGSQVVTGGGEKKKRLNMEQVRALEKTFEQGNKLEPDRKVQLAKALGLKPRQVAIWFQNRRARWKTKQLDKDYSALKRQFDSLKSDHESLIAQNKRLHAELMSLRSREGTEYGTINLNNADTRSYWSNNGSETSSEMNLGNSRTPQTGSPLSSIPSNKIQFSSNSFIPTNSITQLLQSSPSKPNLGLQCSKIDPSIQDDTLICNIFGGNNGDNGGDGGVDQNHPSSFWAWPEQHLN